MRQYDVIVLGAGAAGLMCALTAGKGGRSVLLLDHADRVGAKILISGGGRCNFTNLNSSPECFLSSNPHFAKSALSRYTQHDFLKMVERHGIAWHEKTLGQLFCDSSARDILRMLLDECTAGGVDVRPSHHISGVDHDDGFVVHTHGGDFSAPALVVATGGPSIPKMGATGLAYDIARRFGLSVVEPRPALVPLTFGPDMAPFTELAGVATEVIASTGKQRFREAALFTHRGISGPAILQISSYWRSGEAISLDFAPDIDVLHRLKSAKHIRPKAEARSVLAEFLPNRLAQALAAATGLSGQLANMSDRQLAAAAERISQWRFTPTGTEGYAKAEVTAGGIDTAGLSSRTMEARAVKGLYFIGEAVDVTGWLGGYNFQWAWSSGWSAGDAIGQATL